MRAKLAVLAAVGALLAVLAGFGGPSSSSAQPRRLDASPAAEKAARAAYPASSLIDLKSVAQLRRLFNAKVGLPRLIILASPT